MDKKIKRITMTVLGTCLLGISVGFLLQANLGTDPFTVAVSGVMSLTGVSYGITYMIVVGSLLVLVFIIDKHYVGLGTIVNLLLIGIISEFSYKIINSIYTADTMPVRMVTFIFAITLLCFSSSIYIVADMGVSSYDAISLIMADKKFSTYRVCRIITDVSCLVLGFVLGARDKIGIGTIITAFGLGPITQFFMNTVAKKILYGKDKR